MFGFTRKTFGFTRKTIGFTRKTLDFARKTLDFTRKTVIYGTNGLPYLHALITTRIDYCNSLLYNLPKCSIARLQKTQNQAARILTRTPRCDHITEVLITLHWLKVEQRIIYKILILTYKSFIDLSAPLYLRELVKKKKKSANTRLADHDVIVQYSYILACCHSMYIDITVYLIIMLYLY